MESRIAAIAASRRRLRSGSEMESGNLLNGARNGDCSAAVVAIVLDWVTTFSSSMRGGIRPSAIPFAHLNGNLIEHAREQLQARDVVLVILHCVEGKNIH